MPIAVVTGSPIARGVVAIFNLFVGDQIRAFQPGDLDSALNHAQVRDAEKDSVRTAIERLRNLVGP